MLFCPSRQKRGPQTLNSSGMIASNAGPPLASQLRQVYSCPHDLTISSALLTHQASRLLCVYRCFRTYANPSFTVVGLADRPCDTVTRVHTLSSGPILGQPPTPHMSHNSAPAWAGRQTGRLPAWSGSWVHYTQRGIRIICTDSLKLIGFFVEPLVD